MNCFTGYDQTYGQLERDIKNTISHRFKAVDALRDYFTGEEGRALLSKKLKVEDSNEKGEN